MVKLMDCTLRDGGNVVGKGFNAQITDLVLDGLTSAGVPIVELGNAGGIGAYEVAGFTKAETDETYLKIAQKYMGRGTELGMFLNAKRYLKKSVAAAKDAGLAFLRVGADAGDGAISIPAIKDIKAAGLKAFYSEMKAYVLSADELAEEAKTLEDAGLDMITIMDSAGTMVPEQVAEYTRKMKAAVKIPVAFHCHNNLYLSAANAIAAYENGADILDCGLMGMATNTDEQDDIRADFGRIKAFMDYLRDLFPELTDFKELSIGMSGDWPVAVEFGATIVRIGTAIFGERV